MRFFTPKEEFNLIGRFYGIPVYINTDEDCPLIAGTNIIFDRLFLFAMWFHNFFIERMAQIIAAITQTEYEPGFPVLITGEVEKQ